MTKNNAYRLIALVFVFAFTCYGVKAQGEKATHPKDSTLFDRFEVLLDSAKPGSEMGDVIEGGALERAHYAKAYYEYYRESLSVRRKIFEWNHTSSVIIFWMVIVIVIAGLCFSSIQFYISMLRVRQAASQPGTPTEAEAPATGLKISLSGLEVNSSVLGIIILVLSLAFFYLYLVYVYPVKEYNVDKILNESVEAPEPPAN